MGKFSHTDGVGILWISRDDYQRFLKLVPDGWTFPRTHADWEKRAHEAVAMVQREGGKPIRVEASLDKLIAYCTLRGLPLDSSGRNAFAADPGNWPARKKN